MAAQEAREREAEVVDGDVVREIEMPQVVDAEEAGAAEQPVADEFQAPAKPSRRRPAAKAANTARAPKAAKAVKEPREKKPAKSRSAGARKKPSVAADA